MSKIETTEQAAISIKNAFTKFGLTEEGELPKDKDLSIEGVKSAVKEDAEGIEERSEESVGEDITEGGKTGLGVEDELSTMRDTIEGLKKLLEEEKKSKELAIRAKLDKEKIEAIVKGDPQKVAEIEDKQAKVGISARNEAVIQDFCSRNKDWFNRADSLECFEMTQFTQMHDKELFKLGLPIDKHMDLLEKHVKEKFPNFFKKTTQKSEIVQGVEGGNSKGIVKDSNKGYNFDKLGKEARFIAEEFERMKVMPAEEYLKKLSKEGAK